MVLAWSYWSAQERPKRVLMAFALVCLAVLLVTAIDPWLAVLAGFLLMQTGAEGFFPSRFRLDEEGVSIRNGPRRVRRAWSQFSRFQACDSGYVLVSRSPLTLIRRRRSVYLRCEENREDVRRFLEQRCGDGRP